MRSGIRIILTCMTCLALFSLASCATSTLTSVWKDPAYQGGKLKKIVVIGVTEKQTAKRIFEDEFVAQLRGMGVEGVPGYAVVPQDKAADKSAVEATVARLGADGVIVTRLLDKKTFDTYYPPQVAYVPYRGYYGGWSNYYYGSYTAVTTPGYTLQQQVVVLETNLYATKEEKLIWSGVSETFVEDSAEQLVRTLVGMIVKDLAAKGLI